MPAYWKFESTSLQRRVATVHRPVPSSRVRQRRATNRLTPPAYWKFESISLQQTVRLSRDFSFPYRKAGSCRGVRRARPGSTAGRDARGPSTSRPLAVMSLSGAIPVPQCRLGALQPGCTAAPLGPSWRCHQALSSVRLKKSRARPSARASQVADVNAPAACRRSDRAAADHRGWLR